MKKTYSDLTNEELASLHRRTFGLPSNTPVKATRSQDGSLIQTTSANFQEEATWHNDGAFTSNDYSYPFALVKAAAAMGLTY